ncbi:circularly permuted type 2 ATP-grasp protein [Gynuella sp.]|uniref:circularly permuted type 2 ATP-grasp protein n=1 Tax=Gynuella sp. TaxID=2969146 RepID=UPI003D133BA4
MQQQMQDMMAATGYPKPGDGRDEVYDSEGQVRPHWKYLLESMESLGPEAMRERQKKVSRILRDDGATYKIYQQPEASQVWQLNPVPLLIDSEEWAFIESGMLERSELYNLILEDVYGPQTLIKHNVIPPELVFSSSGFLRSCHQLKIPGSHQLIIHAIDLIRNPSGQLTVISDRCQAPSGAGYALENRTVMTRVFPSLFRDSHVHRLAYFFTQLRLKLNDLNPNGGLPRVVILTPGALNETYFEHVYLSNYLGFPLVQGNDLTVRGGYVWMKSLDGLKRVDVILRRVDDIYCDPVELRGDSHLGVPGIMGVARAGKVVIANPLGSGFLENPALYRYLPAIGRHLQGREPRLQNVRTWWCGDPDDLQYVLDNIATLIIKPCYRKAGAYSVYGPSLDANKLTAWKNRIKRSPYMYVAQEYMPSSCSPTWHQEKMLPRHSVLRTFSVAGEFDYSIMPGGLTRVSLDESAHVVSNQTGSVSKDTWVLASEPEKAVAIKTEGTLEETFSIQQELPSRVAENLFWMGRYAERAEAALRFLRTVFLQLNRVEPLPQSSYRILLKGLTQLTMSYPGFAADNEKLFANPESELYQLIQDRHRAGSVAANLYAMLRSAEQVKEQLTSDTQRIINDIGDELDILRSTLRPGLWSAPEEALDPLVTTLLALSGLVQESMVRDYAWNFIDLGRRLERSLQMISQIRSLFVPCLKDEEQELLVESLLLSNESIITYRRRYHCQPEVGKGLDMLLFDASNPRSILYQLNKISKHLKQLPVQGGRLGAHDKLILEATTAVQLCDIRTMAQEDNNGVRTLLDQLMARIQRLLAATSDALSDRYFDHTAGPQPLVRNTFWQDDL